MTPLEAFEFAAGSSADYARLIGMLGSGLYLLWAAWSFLGVVLAFDARRASLADMGMGLMRVVVVLAAALFLFS